MKVISSTRRKRLKMQGFVDMSDADLAEMRLWLKLSPAISVVWMVIGAILGSAAMIWAMIPFSVLGTILPRHPFAVFYNFGIRFLIGTRALPRYHIARRICCVAASVWAGLVGWAFHTGATILGGLFISVALLPVMIDFCIPAYIYRLLFGKLVSCGTAKA